MSESKNSHIGDRIHNRIIETIHTSERKKKQKKAIFRMLAAVLLLIGGIFSTLYFYKNSLRVHHGEEIFVTNTFGKIILSNGDSIDINTSSKIDSGLIIEEGGYLTFNAAELKNEGTIKIRTDKNGFLQIRLEDGSLVNLNSNSEISYDNNFTTKREVYVTGNAYFKVNKVYDHAHQLTPFTIHGGPHIVEVLGTEFDFNYTENKDLQTTLIEGKVAVKNSLINRSIVMFPGQQVEISNNGSMKIAEVDVEEFSAWKDGYYYFNDRALDEILTEMSKHYEFEFDSNDIPKDRFTLYVKRNRSLSDLLSYVERTSNYKFSMRGKKLLIGGKG